MMLYCAIESMCLLLLNISFFGTQRYSKWNITGNDFGENIELLGTFHSYKNTIVPQNISSKYFLPR